MALKDTTKQLENYLRTLIAWAGVFQVAYDTLSYLFIEGVVSTVFLFILLKITILLTLLSQKSLETSTGQPIHLWKKVWQILQMILLTCAALGGCPSVFYTALWLWVGYAPSLIHSPFNVLFNIEKTGPIGDLMFTIALTFLARELHYTMMDSLFNSNFALLKDLDLWLPMILTPTIIAITYGVSLKQLIFIPTDRLKHPTFFTRQSLRKAVKVHFFKISTLMITATILLTLTNDVISTSFLTAYGQYLTYSSHRIFFINTIYSIVQPFAEELIYRNFLTQLFQKTGLLKTGSTICLETLLPISFLSGWLFAIPHFVVLSEPTTLTPYINLMFSGALYSLITLCSGSIGSSSILHSFGNVSIALIPSHADQRLFYFFNSYAWYSKLTIGIFDFFASTYQYLKRGLPKRKAFIPPKP